MVLTPARAGVIPEGYPVEHYSALWERSPFTIASVQDASQAGFAQNLAVVAIARIGNEDMVILLNKQSQERITVSSFKSNAQGMKVVSVAADTDPLKTHVTIQEGSEVAIVGFDKALLAMTQSPAPAAQNAAPDPNPVQPAVSPGVNPVPVSGRRFRRAQPIPTPIPPPVINPISVVTNPPQ